jgi:branched-chain amino acid transport system ATP-binding protein
VIVGTILRTEKLSRHFGGVKAVNDASLTVEERTVKALIGPNGAGKTTLFNLVTGRFSVTSGKVFLREEEITNKPVHELVRRGICRTFQINSLFLGLSVFENVRIARQTRLGQSHRIFSRRESLTEVNNGAMHILKQVGLQDRARDPATTLSHGDQRSLEVAVALAGDPTILLLDEPTAGMSRGETHRIIRLIEKLVERITIVLVEHDVDMVLSISNSISVLHQGTVIAEGSPDEIRRNSQVRKAYLGEEVR